MCGAVPCCAAFRTLTVSGSNGSNVLFVFAVAVEMEMVFLFYICLREIAAIFFLCL